MIFLIASLYIDYRYIFIYIGILEPLQELRARLGACKTKLRPTVILYYGSFQGDTSLALNICGVFTLCMSSYFSFGN